MMLRKEGGGKERPQKKSRESKCDLMVECVPRWSWVQVLAMLVTAKEKPTEQLLLSSTFKIKHNT